MIKRCEGLKIFSLLVLFFAAVAFSPVFANPGATVTGVKVLDKAGKVHVQVDTNGAVSNYAYRTSNPREAVVVELFPATLASNVTKKTAVNKGLIEEVQLVQATDKQETVKVVVNVVSHPDYKVVPATGKKGVTVELGTAMVKDPATAKKATPAAQVASKPAAKPAAKAPAKKAAPKAPQQKMVSLDLVNADLIYVLKILAKEMNLNIVTDPSVQGSVTMTLKNVPAQGALNLVVKMSGYDYKRVGNTIVVGDRKILDTVPSNIMEAKKGAEVTQAIPLEHAKAADVAAMVTGSYPDAKIQSDPRGTALIVTADPSTLKNIRAFVSQLDYEVPAPVPPKTEIVALKAAVATDVQPLLQKLVPTVSYDVDKRLNSLILTGDDASIALVKDYLDQLDAHLSQISLDVKVVDLTENGQKSFGANWGVTSENPGVLVDTLLTEHQAEDLWADGSADAPDGMFNMPIGYFTRSALTLNFQLQALVESSEAKVLASPKLTCKSGEEASVHIGEKYPIVYYDPRAGQYQVQYQDIGTKVQLTPRVLPDGYVELKINPDISNLLDLVNQQYPRTANRTANVTLRVKDGDTMVLAGLLRESENFSKRKIPLLGDIPLLGEMFKFETRSKQKNEVVIMVTPHILAD